MQFIVNAEKEMQVDSMMEFIEQQPFDLWRILNIFLKLYADMPIKICEQFREIELRIVSELAWKKGSRVIEVLDVLKHFTDESDST